MYTALISALALGQSLLVAHLLARRITYSNVYLPLATFFAVNALVQLCFIVREPSVASIALTHLSEITLLKLIAELALPPLLWIYVRELTSARTRGWRQTDLLHFIFPLAPALLVAFIYHLLGMITQHPADHISTTFIDKINAILNIAALIQFCVYVIFVMRRLKSYRRSLLNFFASTADMELRWFRTALLLVLLGITLEVSAEILYALFETPNPFVPWNGFVRLALVWFFAAWGLRQTPDLRIEIAQTDTESDEVKKYEKSALSADQLAKVSEKIKSALEQDKGYKDPNLSLRTLSEKINVVPNYASQALNMEIKETFFDYVNKLRVLDAMDRLTSTDDTVLAISSEVGFNSRSSFYTAFKKISGQTPTAYRKTHSEPENLSFPS